MMSLFPSTNLGPSATSFVDIEYTEGKIKFGENFCCRKVVLSVFLGKPKSEPDYLPFMHGHLPLPVNSKADYGMDEFGSDGMGGACSLASLLSPRCLCLSLGGGTEIPDSSALSRSFGPWGRLKTARGE